MTSVQGPTEKASKQRCIARSSRCVACDTPCGCLYARESHHLQPHNRPDKRWVHRSPDALSAEPLNPDTHTRRCKSEYKSTEANLDLNVVKIANTNSHFVCTMQGYQIRHMQALHVHWDPETAARDAKIGEKSWK